MSLSFLFGLMMFYCLYMIGKEKDHGIGAIYLGLTIIFFITGLILAFFGR